MFALALLIIAAAIIGIVVACVFESKRTAKRINEAFAPRPKSPTDQDEVALFRARNKTTANQAVAGYDDQFIDEL